MGHFLDIAFRVLVKNGEPMTARAIVESAINEGWLESRGKTPWQTMKSKLSTDILNKRTSSRFMRTAEGRFGLRTWQSEHREFIADRYQKALLDEQIMVFPGAVLHDYIPGPGLHAGTLASGNRLISECRPMQRLAAEDDYSVIQLVSVFVITWNGMYLTYKRTKRLPEARLHNAYSIAFGGHINPGDIPTLFDIFDPKVGPRFIARELDEEVRFSEAARPSLTYRGLLYDDSRDLSRQHLGIVYAVNLKAPDFEIGERGFLIDPKFESLAEIEARIQDFENWSALLVREEKKRRTTEIFEG